MENFEQIDEYVRGRLQGQDKEAFEQAMEGNPSLRSEVKLQQQLIGGIKKARVSELKTMLNQIPVTGSMTGSGISASQIAIGVVSTALVITSTLFYFKPWKSGYVVPASKIEKPVPQAVMEKDSTENEAKTSPTLSDKSSTETIIKRSERKESSQIQTTKKVVIPKIEVINPTEELSESSTTDKVTNTKSEAEVVSSRIEVETNNSSRKYAFHYQFEKGRLILYGAFDKGLYEIIEVNGSSHSVFLFYKDSYYLLNEKEITITPLTPIKDAVLIGKLNDFRKG